jgi:hypothetical protein
VGWEVVVGGQQWGAAGLAGHTLTPPPPTHTSYNSVSFVIAESDTGIVPTKLLPGKRLRACSAQPRRPPPATARSGSMPANRQTGGRVESVSLEGVRYHPARRV